MSLFSKLFGKRWNITRRVDGSWSYMLNGSDGFGGFGGDYLDLSLKNIALFTALDIRSTMFSRGRVFVKDKEGNEIEDDPFLKLIKNPNYAQSQQDLLYSHLWFKSLGNNLTRAIPNRVGSNVDVRDLDKVKAIENLIPSCIDYKDVNKVSSLVVSKSQIKQLEDRKINYKISGVDTDIRVGDIAFFYDVTNNMTDESYFKSPSRIDALIPALMNIQEAQSAKNVNLKHSKKWLVTNQSKDQYGKEDLKPEEKDEIEGRFMQKDIMATNAGVKAESLAVDMRKLLYDDGTAADAIKVFSAYGIPKDVLNWWMNGQSTYDNKDAAVAEWIQNSIQFEASDWGNTWSSFFRYEEEGKTIGMDYSHLPIMQVLEKKRIETLKERVDIAKVLYDMQVPTAKALEISGLEENIDIDGKS